MVRVGGPRFGAVERPETSPKGKGPSKSKETEGKGAAAAKPPAEGDDKKTKQAVLKLRQAADETRGFYAGVSCTIQ